MELTLDPIKAFNIGIDRWFIRGVKVDYPEQYRVERYDKQENLEIGFSEEGNGFAIHTYSKLTKDNELLPPYSVLIFNPNKILDGHNVYNSGVKRTIDAIEKLKLILKEKDITLDFKGSTVDTAEINQNIPMGFSELKDTLDLVFNVMSKGTSKATLGDDKKYFKKNRRKEESYWWINWGNRYRAYNKTKEAEEILKIKLDKEITRYEEHPTTGKFQNIFKEKGISCDFITVLQNFHLIEGHFRSFWKEQLEKSYKYLNTKYYKDIETEYLRFKASQKENRERRKKDPNIKVERGIYKHLRKECEIFDKSFVIRAIDTHEKKNTRREKELALKEFNDFNSLEKLEFMADFFSSLISDNEEEQKP